MKVIVFKHLWVTAITLYPFIIVRRPWYKNDKYLINHEKVHMQQQKELLIIFFYIWYIVEYFFRLLQYQNHSKAYYNISFEREAYDNEQDLDYLKTRKPFSFIDYLIDRDFPTFV